jgi:23S rRNA (cytidine2498-2'-O)-methyltransferase
MSPAESVFAIVCCQNGADSAVKAEVTDDGWRLAYSRRGFLSFKKDMPRTASVGRYDHRRLPSGVFVRTASWSLGLASGEDAAANAAQAIAVIEQSGVALPLDCVHIWPRDRVPVGKFDFEPGVDEVALAVGEMLMPRLVQAGIVSETGFNTVAKRGQRVLDIVLIEPSQWAIGWHPVPKLTGANANSVLPTMWPGGVQPLDPPRDVISRAYFKAAEAIAWSGFDLRPGDTAVEVGASPGGACSLLLEMGLNVVGIDPAEMAPEVLEHKNFRHIRARAGDLPRSEFQGAKWLLVDSNVRPDQTLTTVEHIVMHRASTIRGMILTLKLGGISHADRIAGWVRRVQSWGATDVQVRQLARGKIEVCLVARMA